MTLEWVSSPRGGGMERGGHRRTGLIWDTRDRSSRRQEDQEQEGTPDDVTGAVNE